MEFFDLGSRFASTFFDNPAQVEYVEYAEGEDNGLLRFHDKCPRYEQDIRKSTPPPVRAYRKSGLMHRALELLKTSLALPANATLTVPDAAAAFTACA